MYGVEIPSVQIHKHLGIFISNDGSYDYHVNQILMTAWKRIRIMRSLKLRLDRTSLQAIHFSSVRLVLEYADVILDKSIATLERSNRKSTKRDCKNCDGV